MIGNVTVKSAENRRTIYNRIEPQPTGGGLNDPLDGEWLSRPFDGLLQPTINDLPIEFPYDSAGLKVGVIRVDGEWYWEVAIASLSYPHDEPQLTPKDQGEGWRSLPTSVERVRVLDSNISEDWVLVENFGRIKRRTSLEIGVDFFRTQAEAIAATDERLSAEIEAAIERRQAFRDRYQQFQPQQTI